MAFIADPAVLALDEPFAGLGDLEIDEVLRVFKKYSHQKTILIVEHKISKLTDIVDRLAVMHEGKIIASSSAGLFREFQPAVTSNQELQVSQRELIVEGKPVYETRAPILDGQLGSTHIGIWAGAVEADIHKALFKFVWPISVGFVAAMIAIVMLAQPLVRAVRRLIELRSAAHETATQRVK